MLHQWAISLYIHSAPLFLSIFINPFPLYIYPINERMNGAEETYNFASEWLHKSPLNYLHAMAY